MAKRISYVFGEAGDLTTVPDISTGTELSLQQGWSSAYSLPKGTPGYRFVDRGQHNYLWNAATGNIKVWQENLYPDHYGDVDYPVGMITNYNGVNYIRISGSGAVANPSTSSNYRPYANKVIDSDKLDGKEASEFLGVNDKAADSNLLDGKDSTEFLGVNDKAADSEQLDGKDSTEFVQTGNVSQSILGVKTFNSSPVVPTPTSNNQAASKGYADDVSIGVGQSYLDVTASRSQNVTYTNSTGKPIFVIIEHTQSANTTATITLSSVSFRVGSASAQTANVNSTTFIVPNGSTYRISGASSVSKWLELR